MKSASCRIPAQSRIVKASYPQASDVHTRTGARLRELPAKNIFTLLLFGNPNRFALK